MKYMNLYTEEAKQNPSRINSKKYETSYFIMKLLNSKDKERILKGARKKELVCTRNP